MTIASVQNENVKTLWNVIIVLYISIFFDFIIIIILKHITEKGLSMI